jgi:hypothetical protein
LKHTEATFSPGSIDSLYFKTRRCLDLEFRQVTGAEPKSGAVVKLQRVFVVLKTTSNAKRL